MRRTSRRANWLRMEELPTGSGGRVGDAVSLGFELADYLATVRAGGTLAGEKLRLSPLVRMEESLEPAAGGWQLASARIRLASGLAYSSPVDLRLAGLLAGCDGQRAVGELLTELAAATNSELEKITPNCLALLAELVERGFLLPPGVAGPN